MYSVTVTQGEKAKLGTVNNCTCDFFQRHHSACKHMFVVARRTSCRISERVDLSPISPGTQPMIPDKPLTRSPTSNASPRHSNCPKQTAPTDGTPSLPLHSTAPNTSPPYHRYNKQIPALHPINQWISQSVPISLCAKARKPTSIKPPIAGAITYSHPVSCKSTPTNCATTNTGILKKDTALHPT